MSSDGTDPFPWRRPAIYYGRRYIPGFTAERTLRDVATGKNIVHFNTYDVGQANRIRTVFSATPKITNMYLYEAAPGNTITPEIIKGLLPLSGIRLEIWGYNFAELPVTRVYLNTLHVYVSATDGVFNNDDYTIVDTYSEIKSLSAKNPVFRAIELPYELIPVIDKRRSITQKNPRTLYYTRKNKLRLNLPDINVNEGCIDIILANAAGYTTLNTLTNELLCNQLHT